MVPRPLLEDIGEHSSNMSFQAQEASCLSCASSQALAMVLYNYVFEEGFDSSIDEPGAQRGGYHRMGCLFRW